MNIVLDCFGKRGYYYAAYNLAFSIKHYDPQAKILLIHDGGLKQLHDFTVFDKFHEIDEATTHPKGIFDPANVKLNTYKIATKHFKEYLFLDVDAIALKSLQPFYDAIEKDFVTEVKGSGKINDTINYSVWSSNEDIWNEFGMFEDDVYYAVQSSWHFARKTRANTAMFKDACKLNLNAFEDRKMLKIAWGRSLPDELILGGAITRAHIDPTHEVSPIFFGDKHRPLQEVTDNFYVLSFFGNGIGKTLTKQDYFDFYDRYMIKMFREYGMNHLYKISQIMRDKLINK